MTSFAQKKHSDFAPFVIEARQEVWYAVYGSIAEEGTSPSRAASSFGEALSHARRRRAKPAEQGTIITRLPSYTIAQLANEFASIKVLSLQCRLQNKRCTRCPSPPSPVEL